MNAGGKWRAAGAGLTAAAVGGGAFGLLRFTAEATPAAAADNLFPSLVALGLLAMGALVAMRDLNGNRQRWLAEGELRPCLAVTGSVVAFGSIIGSAGLLPAVFVCVVLAAFGSREAKFRQSIALGLGIAGAVALVFVGLLGLPIKLVTGWP